MRSIEQKRRTKKGPTEKDQILEARREKNREAQHVFRKRRQAAEAATARRLQRLEDVIEEMSSLLIGFFDDILANETLTTQHPSLVGGLKQVMGRVLALTKEVAAMDGDDPLASVDNSTAGAGDSQNAPKHAIANPSVTAPQHKSVPPVVARSLADAPSASGQNMAPRPSLSNYSLTTPISAGYTPTDQFLSLSHSPDVLGSQSPAGTHRPIPGTPFEPAYSFPVRLIEISLTHAYILITTAPLSGIQREFGRTLRHRTREDITATIQWALGPGKWHMHLSAEFDSQGDVDDFFQVPSTDPMALPPPNADHAEVLTAAGVYKLLKNLGAKWVDVDTMEFQLPRPSMAPGITPSPVGTIGHLGWFPLQQLAFEGPTTRTTTMRLDVSLLMLQLMHIGVCFDNGPRYPQRDVWAAIEAAARMV